MKVTEAAIENANLAMRTAVLINGGAAISVLAFAGALASQGKFAVLTQVASSLLWFALGAVAATIAMMFAYATNYCIAERSWSFDRRPEHPYIFPTERWWAWHRAANAFQLLAALGGLASVGLFVYGIIAVKRAIRHLI